MNAKDNETALSCGIPAMPLLAKPTMSKEFKFFGVQSDLHDSYDNGTMINYQCESAYAWVMGDTYSRTCVNGTWRGKVGKCGKVRKLKISKKLNSLLSY